MSIQDPIGQSTGLADTPRSDVSFMLGYLEALSLVERLHRLLLDVIKDEFERVGVLEINAVQALLLFNIGDNEVTAGELKSRGYYQGSNVSYNLKKLVDMGDMHHQRCEIDRRSVRVKLTEKGRKVLCPTHPESRTVLGDVLLWLQRVSCWVLLFAKHAFVAAFRATIFPR